MRNFSECKEFFKLSYDASDLNPMFVNCLELQCDDIYGRKIVTTRDLKTGDVVAVEKPFFKSLDKNSTSFRCLQCLKSLRKDIIDCKSCKSAKFCSEKCRALSWDEFHKFECEDFENFTQDDGFMLMIQRTVFKSLKVHAGWENLRKVLEKNLPSRTLFDFTLNESNEDKALFLSCWSLEAAPSTIDEEQIASSFVNDHAIIRKISKSKEEKKCLKNFIARLIGIFNHNLFTLNWNYRESSNEETACGLFPFISFMNHSCAPNIFRVCFEGKVAFTACRPIKANEQLFMSYQYRFYQAPTMDRQTLLAKQFDFKCLCEACQSNYPLLKDLKKLDPKFIEPINHFESVNEAVQCWRRNCDYVDAHCINFPSYEIVRVMQNNHRILRFVAASFDGCQ